jgi:putative transposase
MHWAPQEIRTYHVTAVTANRRRLFQVEATAELFLSVLQTQRQKLRMEIHAFVVMPDHVHVLLTPAENVSLEKAVQFIKGGFSFLLRSKLEVWQKSYNQTQMLSVEKFAACRKYLEMNPVRQRIVLSREEFAYSSASRVDLVDPAPLHLREKARG